MRLDDGVHRLVHADNGVHGTCARTQIAADACGLIDSCNAQHARSAESVVERNRFSAEKVRELFDRPIAAGRTAVDLGVACGYCRGVRAAARITALRALDSRQELLYLRNDAVVPTG
jgi:hypothetical protein